MDDVDVAKLVEARLQRFMLQLATSMEINASLHPEITVIQYAAIIRVSAAELGEDWNIEKFMPV